MQERIANKLTIVIAKLIASNFLNSHNTGVMIPPTRLPEPNAVI